MIFTPKPQLLTNVHISKVARALVINLFTYSNLFLLQFISTGMFSKRRVAKCPFFRGCKARDGNLPNSKTVTH